MHCSFLGPLGRYHVGLHVKPAADGRFCGHWKVYRGKPRCAWEPGHMAAGWTPTLLVTPEAALREAARAALRCFGETGEPLPAIEPCEGCGSLGLFSSRGAGRYAVPAGL